MQRKIRKQHQLAAPRNLVYNLMTELDPDGLEQRESVKVPAAPLLCFLFPILIFFYLEVKPLDYALHIVPVRWFLFCISIVVLTENVIRDLCFNVQYCRGQIILILVMVTINWWDSWIVHSPWLYMDSMMHTVLKALDLKLRPQTYWKVIFKTLVWVKGWDIYTGQC